MSIARSSEPLPRRDVMPAAKRHRGKGKTGAKPDRQEARADHDAGIAIIDSNAQNRADLQTMLDDSGYRVVASAGYGVEAVATVKEAAVDCILLSLQEPIVRGLQTMEALEETAPNAHIIVYSSIEDSLVVRQAMQAGARDFIHTPLRKDVLVPAIQQALDQGQALLRRQNGGQPADAAHGTVVTVFATKGGVGRSTIAANLAFAIARQTDASVVLVDVHSRFGNLSVLLNIATDKSLAQACRDVETISHTNVREYLFELAGGVFVLPSPGDPAAKEAINAERVRSLIAILSQSFDYVILDTAGTLNDVVAVTLEQATIVLLLTSLDITSVSNTLTALKLLSGWSYPEDRIKLIVNHPYSVTGITQDELAEALGGEPFWQIPYDDAVPRSVQQGQPFVLANPQAQASKSITALARKIGGVAPPVRGRRFGGLRSLLNSSDA